MGTWIQLLLGALDITAIGALIVTLATLHSAKRKANADADKAGAEADKETVKAMREAYDAMKDALSEIRASNDRFLEVHARDETTIAEKNAMIVDLTTDNTALKMLACKHDACPFREPVKGRGAAWWEAHKNDEQLTDTESIYQIGKKYGYAIKRLPVKTDESNGNNQ